MVLRNFLEKGNFICDGLLQLRIKLVVVKFVLQELSGYQTVDLGQNKIWLLKVLYAPDKLGKSKIFWFQ